MCLVSFLKEMFYQLQIQSEMGHFLITEIPGTRPYMTNKKTCY